MIPTITPLKTKPYIRTLQQNKLIRNSFQVSVYIFSSKTEISYLGYAYCQGYEAGYLGVVEKNCIMAGKGHLFAVTGHKFVITATVSITNILLISRVQFMETGCQGVRKWKKFGNRCSKWIWQSILFRPTKFAVFIQGSFHTNKNSEWGPIAQSV
jgi:hypothetical protein